MRGKTITHEEYIKLIKEKHPDIEVISKFSAMCKPISLKCLVDDCNYEWATEARSPYRGCGCPKCSSRKRGLLYRTDNDIFINRLKECNPYVQPLEKYETSLKPIKCKCLICGDEFVGIPRNLLQGRIHYECSRIS